MQKTWRHHVVGAAGILAIGLLVALTWFSLRNQRAIAAPADGFFVLRDAGGRPVESARVVALRREEVRWARDTNAQGVIPYRRGGGRVDVLVRVAGDWFYRTTIDLADAFNDVDLPLEPQGPAPRIAGDWTLEDLPEDVRAALAGEPR